MVMEVVQDVLHRHCRVPLPIDRQARLIEDLGLDSVGLLTLMTELENHYQRAFQEDEEHPPRTVAELVSFLEEQLR